uniref:Uncharacterized protein n=1 Tax=Onchocerca volvulus TaxID=6282 RepID=A0A8R1TKL7_ONCVO
MCNQKDDSKKSLMLCISPAAACSTGTIQTSEQYTSITFNFEEKRKLKL